MRFSVGQLGKNPTIRPLNYMSSKKLCGRFSRNMIRTVRTVHELSRSDTAPRIPALTRWSLQR